MKKIVPKTHHIIWAIDFDGVLNDSQASGQPNFKNINKVNELWKHSDNFVVIYTARTDYFREEIELWLKKWGVRYDLLQFGKLKADVYVDDKNVNW